MDSKRFAKTRPIHAASSRVLNAKAAERFGIPAFLPWPASTILGFYAVVAIGATVLKTSITTGGVRLFVHSGRSRATDGC